MITVYRLLHVPRKLKSSTKGEELILHFCPLICDFFVISETEATDDISMLAGTFMSAFVFSAFYCIQASCPAFRRYPTCSVEVLDAYCNDQECFKSNSLRCPWLCPVLYLGLTSMYVCYVAYFELQCLSFSSQARNNKHVSQDLKSNYVSLPVNVRYSANRVNNYRPYIMAGVNPMLDLSKRKEAYIEIKKYDFCVEVGTGCDLYLQLCKNGRASCREGVLRLV